MRIYVQRKALYLESGLKLLFILAFYDTTFYIVTCFRKIHNLFQRSLDFYLQFRKNKDNKEVNFPFLNVDYKVKMADHDLQNVNKWINVIRQSVQ